MTVVAHLHEGDPVELDAALGDTPEKIVQNLTAGSLTGSAVPLDSAWIKAADGSMIRYGNVARLALK